MKKLIALLTASAMLASSAAVLADEINTDEILDGTIHEVQGDIMLISNPDPIPVAEIPAIPASYVSHDVTITEINDGLISATLNGVPAEEETADGQVVLFPAANVVNFTVSDETLVFSYLFSGKPLSDIKVGDMVTVYTDAYAPMLMMLPAQYQADVIIIHDDIEIDSQRLADVDTYIQNGEQLVNAANTLALNIDETTAVVDRDGNAVSADDLARKDLLVFYTNSTRSIPAQTTPSKVVVLGENEAALANIDAGMNTEPTLEPDIIPAPAADFRAVTEVKVGDKSITNVYAKGDTVMVPLREIAETLGLTVDWDGELKAVMIGGGIYSLQIGENSYVKGRMTPISLKYAPEITNDLTYVPVEYFVDVIEAQITPDTANTISIDWVVTSVD